jgi:hypothetical protein
MKITESLTRDCCHPTKDLRKYGGKPIGDLPKDKAVMFCVHCGQLWRWHRAPGEMDGGLDRVTILTTGDP